MKTKHLFASAVMAAVLAGCSQDEPIVMNNDNLGERPMVEAPSLTIGGVESRMTAEEVTAAGFANVKWEAGDGFGAAVMDSYVAGGETWDKMFPIQNYISSNVLFKTEDGKNFYADASMPMGNHLFYAPFNLTNISRAPLATQLPLEQIVVPTTNGMPSNSAIAAFFEDETSPVFVAYDKVTDEPKTSLDLEMRHIYSLPLVTLELGNVQLLDEEGNLKQIEVEEDKFEDVYEESITIDAIKFVQNNDNKKIVTKGYVDNAAIKNLLAKTNDGVVWDAVQYETAATEDILNVAEETETSSSYETITVTFEGGLELTKAKDGKFFMVLPGADYTKEQLAVYVYATINGESYVSADKSTDEEAAAIKPFRAARLLPGQPYPAHEYDANGNKKPTAGTSMTYTVKGGFIPTETVDVETTGYVDIKTYDELVAYVEKVAYRGEILTQITKDEAIKRIEKNGEGGYPTYDKKSQFVITATEAAPIKLDNEFVEAFMNSCVISGGNAKINFLSNKNLVLGDMEWTAEATELISFGSKAYAYGDVTLKTAPAATVELLSTAELTLDAAMESPVTVINAENGIVNLNSVKAHSIWNDYGTLNVNVSSAASIWNGETSVAADNTDEGVLNIAANVETLGTIWNRLTGTATIDDAIVSIKNDGLVTMAAKAANLTIVAAEGTYLGKGTVDNTIGAKITNNAENTVYATVSSLNLSAYDKHTALNKLVLNGVLYTDNKSGYHWINNNIKTIDFVAGSGINYASQAGYELDLSEVETINILANVTWRGRDFASSSVTAQKIVEAENCELTIVELTVKSAKNDEGNYDGIYVVSEGVGIDVKDNGTQNVVIENAEIEADTAVEVNLANGSNYVQIADSKIKANVVFDVKQASAVTLERCDITLPEDGKLVVNNTGHYLTVIFQTGTVKINGVVLTRENANGELAKYFENVDEIFDLAN